MMRLLLQKVHCPPGSVCVGHFLYHVLPDLVRLHNALSQPSPFLLHVPRGADRAKQASIGGENPLLSFFEAIRKIESFLCYVVIVCVSLPLAGFMVVGSHAEPPLSLQVKILTCCLFLLRLLLSGGEEIARIICHYTAQAVLL